MAKNGKCSTCGEPLYLTDVGLVGNGGVCRNELNPNQDDEGLHILNIETTEEKAERNFEKCFEFWMEE